MGQTEQAAGAGRAHRSAADTRAALIAGAIATLRGSGFAAASARRVAKQAGCNQALIFYHFGSVPDLLMAALEDISARRMAAYRGLLGHTGTLADLVDSAREIVMTDLDEGHVTVLVEMISGAQSVPGLGERIAACLAPWREFAEKAVRDVLAASPVASLVPAEQAAHAVVAGILGLELLASLDGDRAGVLALFDRARTLGALLDRLRPLAALLDLSAPKTSPNPTAGEA
ncbi:MAG: TetR/AcrR family transcriptional regulator [Streptosporangiaceae bacterium]|nr:TetR/AcrR family transcriptional regulator [Streptosporangiaceae bacterium]MBV9854783.1 TetR/AcrR family transcriptional regulator [Streptosporangiaceae bacterium]